MIHLDPSHRVTQEYVALFDSLGLQYVKSYGNFVLVKVGDAAAVNEKLLRALGFHGTPGLVYLDAEGRLKRFPGLPDTGDLQEILGAP